MDATLIIRRRAAFGDRDFVEMVVWRVPEPVSPATHGFKYRFVDIDRLVADFLDAVATWRAKHGQS